MEEFGVGNVGNGGIIRRPSYEHSYRASQKQEAVKGVRGSAPPPFLTKTFKMVDDPCTNHIISWSSSGTSLIILDHLKFAVDVLPVYFRHSNFSSFLYQLNNYGFKKIGLMQYEYENKWFQAGQEHLLVNIKRRSEEDSTKPRTFRRYCFGVDNYGMEGDIANIMYNINSFKVEIPKLKRQLGHLESCIATFQQNVEEMGSKSGNLFMFLGRVFSPQFVEKITQRVEEEQELEIHEVVKRRRLVSPEDSKNSDPSQEVKKKNEAENSSNPKDSVPKNNEPKECDPYRFWEKIVGDDDSASENNESEKELAKQHSRFEAALDDMMASKIVAEAEGLNGKAQNLKHLDDEVSFELWA